MLNSFSLREEDADGQFYGFVQDAGLILIC